MRSKPENFRCVICDQVSCGEIESDLAGATYKTFQEIEYGQSGVPAYLCYDCSSSINDVMSEYDDNEEGEYFDE